MPRKTKDSAPKSSLDGGSLLTVTAQQSRYALDAVDAPTTREVLVKDLSISVGQKEVLSHANLHLVEGRHYGLVGRNGTGKSTLLMAMAEGRVPGIPWSLRVLLLGQTREDTELSLEDLRVEDEVVLQHVVRSNKTRERLIREAAVLSAALDNATDASAAVHAYRIVKHGRLQRTLDEAHQVVQRRSGAKGWKARGDLVKLEERFETSRADLELDLTSVDPARIANETQLAADMLADIQSSLEAMDAGAAEAKAREVLHGLGFSDEMIAGSTSKLSGGWRTRCDLACALIQEADVLLLDEPTNFLDLPAIIWFQNYMGTLSGTTVVVVTHDRDFVDAIAEELIVLRNQVLETFRGNLSAYELQKRKHYKYIVKMRDANEKQKAHIEKAVANNVKAAKEKGDDKKLKQAASRQKKLDNRMGIEVGLKGGRFKLNRDLGGYHLTARAEIEVPEFDPPIRLHFPSEPPDLRFPGALVDLEGVCFVHAGTKRGTLLLKDVNLTIHPGERVGLAGLNGSGKSTLVSLIMGIVGGERNVMPTKGSITRHARARFGRFSQHAVEELSSTAGSETAMNHLMKCSDGVLTEQEARGILGQLGLQGQTVSDVPIAHLSGGQRVRLALAMLLWQPPHLLILDEVTTHLDADTILALVSALKGYQGALLVVTHDRFFMRCVVEGESPFSVENARGLAEGEEESSEDDGEISSQKGIVYRIARSELKRCDGGMRQYEEIAARRAMKAINATSVS